MALKMGFVEQNGVLSTFTSAFGQPIANLSPGFFAISLVRDRCADCSLV